MPPTEKKVPAEQIAIIERWIAALARRQARSDDLGAGDRRQALGRGSATGQ
jgi:hypothetical protein